MRKLRPADMAFISLFIALQIILTRFCSIQTPIVRIDLNFLAVSLCAAIYGPLWGGVAAAAADFLGVTLFPSVGAWFPGFTVTMFFVGATYGVFLHNKEKSYARIAFAVVIVMVVFSLGFDTLWIIMLYKRAFLAVLPARLLKCVVMIPVQITLIRIMWRTTGARIEAYANRCAE